MCSISAWRWIWYLRALTASRDSEQLKSRKSEVRPSLRSDRVHHAGCAVPVWDALAGFWVRAGGTCDKASYHSLERVVSSARQIAQAFYNRTTHISQTQHRLLWDGHEAALPGRTSLINLARDQLSVGVDLIIVQTALSSFTWSPLRDQDINVGGWTCTRAAPQTLPNPPSDILSLLIALSEVH